MKRGGYPGNRVRECRFKDSLEFYQVIKEMSEERQVPVSQVFRELVTESLNRRGVAMPGRCLSEKVMA